jgi:hypothetical protein
VASKREKLCIHLDDDFGGWESPFEYLTPLGNYSPSATQNSDINTDTCVTPEGQKREKRLFRVSHKYCTYRRGRKGPLGRGRRNINNEVIVEMRHDGPFIFQHRLAAMTTMFL